MYWAYKKITDYTEEELQCVYDRLTPSRKARIRQLRRAEDKKRSLAAEALVYHLLRKHWGITCAQLHSRSSGEPYLTGCPLHVSISHCDQVVACAVSQVPVGIDVERIQPIDPGVCRYACVAEEMEYVFRGTQPLDREKIRDTDTLQRFFEVWTAKEAYFKKCGTGITDMKLVNILPLQRQSHVAEDYFIQIL